MNIVKYTHNLELFYYVCTYSWFNFIIETWLHKDDILIVPEYINILRCDRLTRGECVAVWIQSNISCKLISTLCCDDGTFEFLSYDVQLNNTVLVLC